MPKKRADLPVLGVADNTTFVDQPGLFAPPTRMRNVRPRRVNGRAQLGQRPGLVPAFPTVMGGGLPVQGMGVVSIPQAISGYRIGNANPLGTNGRFRDTQAPNGGVFSTNAQGGSRWFARLPTASFNGPTGASVAALALTPDNRYCVAAANYTDTVTGTTRALVCCYDAKTGQRLWSHAIVAANARFVNSLEASNSRVFICTNNAVRVLRLDTGAQLGSDWVLNGWCNETIRCRVSPDGLTLFIGFIGSNGSPNPTLVLPSGVVITRDSRQAMHWRSGVMKAAVQDLTSLQPLIQVPWSSQLPSTDRYAEYSPGPHNYLRLSEKLPGGRPIDHNPTAGVIRSPRGCFVTDLAVDWSDGSVFVSHTNTGWGPSANPLDVYPTKPMNDYAPPTGPYRTLSKFDSSGELVATTDTQSIIEVGDSDATTYFNDIPVPSTPGDDPTVLAIGLGQTAVFGGGRRNAAVPMNIWAFDKLTLNPLWFRDVGSTTIRQNGCSVTAQGAPLFGGDRVSGAHAWLADAESGDVLQTFDQDASVSCLSVASDSLGNLYFATDDVP